MKIPFGKTFSVTPAQLKDGVAEGLIDGYIDYDGAYKSRPGLTAWATLTGNGIDGLYTDNDGTDYAVCDGIVYHLAADGTATACTGATLNSGTLCTFAEDVNYVFIGHGGYIAKLDKVTKVVSLIATASAPDGVTHVVYIQGYLLSNGTSGIVGDTFYSGPFTVADYLEVFEVYNSESLSDGTYAVMEDGQFVYNLGSRSIEVATNDGVTPWAKYLSFVPYGIHAPYSVVKIDNRLFWLGIADNSLRVMTMIGGAAKAISTPYDAIINNLTDVEAAYGYSAGVDGHTFYVLQLNATLTLVYHIQQDTWYRWQNYDTATGAYKPFKGRCHTYSTALGKNVIGTTTGANIATFAGFDDLGDIIRFELTSGNITGGTYKQKRAGRMRFQLERGNTSSPTEVPVLMWSHRDDGLRWNAERQVSLGSLGQYGYLGQLDRNGLYRERQHRLSFTDDSCQLVLVDVEEDTKLLKD